MSGDLVARSLGDPITIALILLACVVVIASSARLLATRHRGASRIIAFTGYALFAVAMLRIAQVAIA